MDRAIDLTAPVFQKVWLGGDTNFSLARNCDRWDDKVSFVFGYGAKTKLIEMAERCRKAAGSRSGGLPVTRSKPNRVPRPENVQEQTVKEREFENIRLESEQVTELDYRPVHCRKTYRMVVVWRKLTVEKGEIRLFDDLRSFFYITKDREMAREEIVLFANNQCNQENVIIGQLKAGSML